MSNVSEKKRCLPKWMDTLYQQKNTSSSTADLEINNSSKNLSYSNDDKDKKSSNASYFVDSGATSSQLSTLSAADIVSLSMPLLSFQGTLVYSSHYSDCACICLDILSSLNNLDKTVIGFDMEWPVSYQKGTGDKTALIQMCLSDKTCYLFHVAAMVSFPKPLETLILDDRVLLVGLNITSDMWKLARDFDVKVKIAIDRGSVVDIGNLANQKLKIKEKWALEGLCKNVLRHRLAKDHALRCGDWADVPLSNEQKMYAATDALASLLVYKKLQEK